MWCVGGIRIPIIIGFSSLRYLNPAFLEARATRKELQRYKKSLDISAIGILNAITRAVARLPHFGLITTLHSPYHQDPIMVHRYLNSPSFSEDDFILVIDEKRPGYSYYLKIFHSDSSRPHFFLPISWPYSVKQYRVRAHLAMIGFSKIFFRNRSPPLALEWADERSDPYYLGFEDITVLNLMDSSSSSFPFFPFFQNHALPAVLRDLRANFDIESQDFFSPANMTWGQVLIVPDRVRMNFGPSKTLKDYISFQISMDWKVSDLRITLGKSRPLFCIYWKRFS